MSKPTTFFPGEIGESKYQDRKLPNGIFNGTWQGYMVWVYGNETNKIFDRFQTEKPNPIKLAKAVKVQIIKGIAKIYERGTI